jgi:site-specific DNA recombinase
MKTMDKKSTSKTSLIRPAIYARVSSELQSQQGTIDSQREALVERVRADGLTLDSELIFIDDGFSGSTLVRPALEKMRDTAWAGGFTRLYVHSPDRLARKYAWQVLLVEELQRQGIEIVFLNREIGVSPEEDLLLQMQGVIAEFERAKIMERSRRGKRHAAKRGSVNVLGAAPYGYRYITKHAGGGEAQYQVVPEEARVVKQIFEWFGIENASLRDIRRRLCAQGVPSAKGKSWHPFTIRKLLTNPAYKGKAAFGKSNVGERRARLRPTKGNSEQPRVATSRYATPKEKQIEIPVSVIVNEDLFDMVADRLNESRTTHYQQEVSQYLLQGLVACGCCGHAWYGKGLTRYTKNEDRKKSKYPYYRCIGMDNHRFEGGKICKHRPIRLDQLDVAVWTNVCELLRNPQMLQQEFDQRLATDQEPDFNGEQIKKQIATNQRAISRLIDAYEDGLLEKKEFENRITRARTKLARLQSELEHADMEATRRKDLQNVLGKFDEFVQHVSTGLDQASFDTRREIIRCLVKEIKIEDQHVRITYRVAPRPFGKGPLGGQIRQKCHYRVQRDPSRVGQGG